MRQPISACPSCNGQLTPVKLQCTFCGLSVEGRFSTSKLALLSAEQQQFVEAFLVSRGNIKEAEKELGISYPTVRKRLDGVVQALGHAPREVRLEQHEILDAVDQGDMSPQEGIALLKTLQSGTN